MFGSYVKDRLHLPEHIQNRDASDEIIINLINSNLANQVPNAVNEISKRTSLDFKSIPLLYFVTNLVHERRSTVNCSVPKLTITTCFLLEKRFSFNNFQKQSNS